MVRERGRKVITQNRKAHHEYLIEAEFECGLVLVGTEVKSLRAGRANLTDAYAVIRDGELWLRNAHIPEYTEASWTNHEPRRERKLLLHRHEILRLIGKTKESGHTLVPLSMYFKDGYAKVELALAKGKKLHDKRQALAAKQLDREARRDMVRAARRR